MQENHTIPSSNREELARLNELLSLNILDTQREERFDRYTRLASQIFGVPASSISLIDENRQWFKSSVGVEVTETDRNDSFCTHALKHDFLEVPDAAQDGFFRDHPAVVSEPFVRFYAGAVLRGPTGQPIGTLCIHGPQPRRLSETEREWLIALGRMVEEDILQNSELVQNRRKIQDVTLRDPGTGLPGETLFRDTLDNLVQMADAEGRNLAIIHLRVDNLDSIIRVHGRMIRNRVLENLAVRLTAPDSGLLAVGKIGPARFGLVSPVNSARDVFDAVIPLLNSLSEPIEFNGHAIRAEIDAGVSIFPDDGTDAENLLERARIALRDPFAFQRVHAFTEAADKHAVRRHSIEQRLEIAIRNDLLTFNYQPIFTADGQRIVGFEALARWQDQQLGFVSPGEFIPIAERNERLSRALTAWALRTACAEAGNWYSERKDEPIYVAVNVPAREFYRDDFIDLVLSVLSEMNLEPSRLALELTEESLVADMDQAIHTMQKLGKHGIRLALDDFGTGYSSLSYLRRLPVHTLKIDKSFVDDLPDDPQAAELSKGIMWIAHSLGLRIVAEGVEHEAQRAVLEQLGCDMIQGYLLGRPADAEIARELVNLQLRCA